MSKYIFKSARLGFRNWHDSDLDALFRLTSDPEVMRYFPAVNDREATSNLLSRLKTMNDDRGYTYFAVELLVTGEFIGFIGLAWQEFESPWTPFTDIGWRLAVKYWNQGYASEGAKRVLTFALETLELKEIYAVASKVNLPSINVMEKIGMTKIGEFKHSKLIEYPELKDCVVYKISQ